MPLNGYERTLSFMPLVVEWVSRQQRRDYPEFVYDPIQQADAYLACAERFHLDCILPDADFYEQLEDFGTKPVYGDGGFHAAPILTDPADIAKRQMPAILPGTHMGTGWMSCGGWPKRKRPTAIYSASVSALSPNTPMPGDWKTSSLIWQTMRMP